MSRTVLYDLPPGIRGFIREDEDGEAVYIINSKFPPYTGSEHRNIFT